MAVLPRTSALIPALWLGGMATHGLLRRRRWPPVSHAFIEGRFSNWPTPRHPWRLADGLGRIGNFIDGQIVGQRHVFGGASIFRTRGFLAIRSCCTTREEPAADSLSAARPATRTARQARSRRGSSSGTRSRGSSSICCRDYPTHRLALGTGQTLNMVMVLLGAGSCSRSRLRRLGRLPPREAPRGERHGRLAPRRSLNIRARQLVLAFWLTIPSNWTQDVPGRYGKRHPGLHHSWLYPKLATAPAVSRVRTFSPSSTS